MPDSNVRTRRRNAGLAAEVKRLRSALETIVAIDGLGRLLDSGGAHDEAPAWRSTVLDDAMEKARNALSSR